MSKARSQPTPAALGYSFPPEWHPHTATWFSWPRPEGISFPAKYHTVPANLAAIMREIAPREQVHINVPNGNWEHIVRQQLKENRCPTTNVYFHHIKTTESCLLNKNRNPKLSKKQIEQYLKDYYGQKHVLWLGEGIAGDDTDGHIDDLARFINPTIIVTAIEDDPKDENYQILRDNLKKLQSFKRFKIIT